MYWPTLFGQDDRILNKSFAFSPKIKENIQLSQSSANPLGQYRISLAGQTREIPTGKTGLLCPLGEPIETIDSLQLAYVRTRSWLSNKDTYPNWRLWGGVLRDDVEFGPILFGSDRTLFTPTLTVKHASGAPSTFCWTPPAQTPYLSWAQLNRPFAKLGHVLGYHLATALWMASHPGVHSDHKAFSPIKRSTRNLIFLLKN